jgi:hypothetical protein
MGKMANPMQANSILWKKVSANDKPIGKFNTKYKYII